MQAIESSTYYYIIRIIEEYGNLFVTRFYITCENRRMWVLRYVLIGDRRQKRCRVPKRIRYKWVFIHPRSQAPLLLPVGYCKYIIDGYEFGTSHTLFSFNPPSSVINPEKGYSRGTAGLSGTRAYLQKKPNPINPRAASEN